MNFFKILVLVCGIVFVVNAKVNTHSAQSRHIGIKITEQNINEALAFLCRTHYLAFASAEKVTFASDILANENFAITMTNAVVDFQTLNDELVCAVDLDAHCKGNLKGNKIGLLNWQYTTKIFDLRLWVKLVIQKDDEGAYNLVMVPLGWDEGVLSMDVSFGFGKILGMYATCIYNHNPFDIVHYWDNHFLNKEFVLMPLQKFWKDVPDEIQETMMPSLHYEQRALTVGLKVKPTPVDMTPINMLLLD